VVVWGNGGCAISSARLQRIPDHDRLARLPRHGNGPASGRNGGDATAGHLRKAIDWAAAENRRVGSPLNRKIANRASGGYGPVLRRVSGP
jgi:hypothetical protein